MPSRERRNGRPRKGSPSSSPRHFVATRLELDEYARFRKAAEADGRGIGNALRQAALQWTATRHA